MGLTSLGLGIATGLALALVGFPDAALWGAVTAVLTLIPYAGPLLVALALLSAGSQWNGVAGAMMLVPCAIFLALHFVEANLAGPLFMSQQLRLRALFVFLSVMVWGSLWGLGGALVATPLLLVMRSVFRHSPSLQRYASFLEGAPIDAVAQGPGRAQDLD